jgi:prefoldin subunit 5
MDAMNKEYIIAKIRRQQAEIGEIICAIKGDRRMSKMVEILERRYNETSKLLEALGDKSFIPRGVEEVDIGPDLEKIEKKTEKVKSAIKRLKKLEKEKKKIESQIAKEK